ncbi:MAG TPA: ribonuclease HIII [Kiritimatiellae bacterium]|nr:ribonuclease HIII [Kiritimatiellia bacterium]
MKRTVFSYVLTPQQQESLEKILRSGLYRPLEEKHTRIAAAGDGVRVSLYRSGKCVVQGKKAEEWVLYTLEPRVLKKAEIGYEDVLYPDKFAPHAGVDESGKGDYFGPLVVAAVYLDPSQTRRLLDEGIRDSKKVSSARAIADMERKIRKLSGGRSASVVIGPAKYNELYRKMRNANRILAWGHARAIENLRERVPECQKVISDKFARDHVVLSALMRKGRAVTLEQKHRAESYPAVAAASILARAAFLRYLKSMEKKYRIAFPAGASAQVVEAAAKLVKERGAAVLLEVAKYHFRTTRQALQRAGMTPQATASEPGNPPADGQPPS